MNKYLKPMIIENTDMSEGVYMASGAGTSAAQKNYSIRLQDAGNEWYKVARYVVTFLDVPDGGAEKHRATAVLSIGGDGVITDVSVGNAAGSAVLSGDTITVNLEAYGNEVQLVVAYSKSGYTIS